MHFSVDTIEVNDDPNEEDTLRSTIRKALGLVVALTAAVTMVDAGTLEFDFEKSTPVGAWQEREQVTEEGSKTTITVMKIKYLGDEERGGDAYSWVETEVSSFKIKKKGRTQRGDTAYVKILLKKSLLHGDVVNSIGNFSGIASEIIMQTGDNPPMRIKDAGAMMGGFAQAAGLQINYEFSKEGSESVTVPAGGFECDRYRGSGTATIDLMIKKMTVESRSTQWISDDVPFGVVKVISDDVINGKTQHSETTLTSFGRSGAVSMVTGEPQDMPEMPSLGKMFGG